MDLVLFGMQGSGKGTQAKVIAEERNLIIFETGAELRKLAKEDSPLAKKVQSVMEAGNLVSTDLIMEIVSEFLENLPEGSSVLFDGIPRSADQKEAFDTLMKEKEREFTGVLIELSEEEAMKRLSSRRILVDGKLVARKDDTPEAIRVRLDTFAEKTLPVINGYKAENKMLSVNGEQSIEEVTSDILSLV